MSVPSGCHIVSCTLTSTSIPCRLHEASGSVGRPSYAISCGPREWYVQVDAHPFKHWYESHYGLSIGVKKSKKSAPKEEKTEVGVVVARVRHEYELAGTKTQQISVLRSKITSIILLDRYWSSGVEVLDLILRPQLNTH